MSPVVYRCYDASGALLYIGSSVEFERRAVAHATTSWWWRDVRGIELTPFDSESAARIAEIQAIAAERPIVNVHHNGDELGIPDGDDRHGTPDGFRLGCRCTPCVAARLVAFVERRQERAAKREQLAPDDPRHGRLSTYNHFDCRCDLCTEACRTRSRERYRRSKTQAA